MRGQLLPVSCVVIKSCVVTLETKTEKVLKVRLRWSKNEKKTGNFGQPLPTGGEEVEMKILIVEPILKIFYKMISLSWFKQKLRSSVLPSGMRIASNENWDKLWYSKFYFKVILATTDSRTVMSKIQ